MAGEKRNIVSRQETELITDPKKVLDAIFDMLYGKPFVPKSGKEAKRVFDGDGLLDVDEHDGWLLRVHRDEGFHTWYEHLLWQAVGLMTKEAPHARVAAELGFPGKIAMEIDDEGVVYPMFLTNVEEIPFLKLVRIVLAPGIPGFISRGDIALLFHTAIQRIQEKVKPHQEL